MIQSLLLILSNQQAMAAGAHSGDGIPTVVFWQAANLLVIFVALYFVVGKKAVGFFSSKKTEFLSSAEKSKKIREEAERKVKEIQDRLAKLESTSAESVQRAQAESADLKKQLINEAQNLATRIKTEAAEAARTEVLRAQRELHKDVALESIKMAQEVLKKDTTQADQQKLQDQFSNQIEGVKI